MAETQPAVRQVEDIDYLIIRRALEELTFYVSEMQFIPAAVTQRLENARIALQWTPALEELEP